MPMTWSPFRSRNPCCIIRRRAAWRSPWYRRSSVISSSTASASRSNPTWVPSHLEYRNRDVLAIAATVPDPLGEAAPGAVVSGSRSGDADAMHVDIWSDVACPWCYVGTQRFGRAVQETGVDVDVVYRSFELDPRVPVGDSPLLRRLPRAEVRRPQPGAGGPRPPDHRPAPSSASTSAGAGCGGPTPSTPTGCWPGRCTSTAPTSSAR